MVIARAVQLRVPVDRGRLGIWKKAISVAITRNFITKSRFTAET
jgi:hypothetical protein